MTSSHRFPHVVSHGSPREVGQAHGETLADLVRASVEACRVRVEQILGIPWATAHRFAHSQRERLGELDPGLVAEIEGIAEGADLEPIDIVTLHVRTALSRMVEQGAAGASTSDLESDGLECTTLSVSPRATSDGHVLAAQNWDMHASYSSLVAVIVQHIDGEPALLFVTEAGMLFSHGMNDAGLAILGNALHSHQTGSPDRGVPVQVIRRRAMRQRSVQAARAVIDGLDRAHAVNHLLADASGVAVDLEAVPQRVYAVGPDRDVLVHTNHVVSDGAQRDRAELPGAARSDSLHRFARARALLTDRSRPVDVGVVQAVLRDHDGQPESICRHPLADAPPNVSSTVSSSVFDLSSGKMWNTPGPPCIRSATSYQFGESPLSS